MVEGANTASGLTIGGAFALLGGKEPHTAWRSSTITREKRLTDILHNPHPGEILLEDFLRPLSISQNRLARSIGVPPRRINEIVLGKRRVTADTDLRLARFFGMSDGFWLGLQADHDLLQVRRQLADRLDREVRPLSSAAA